MIDSMKKFFNKKEISITGRGFTILETLIGISILTLAITATFSSVQAGLSSSISARDQVLAFQLAQEAVEFIRNTRDGNTLNGVNWLTGISAVAGDPCYFGKACTVDATKTVATGALAACSGAPGAGSCPNIRQDISGATYLYGMTGAWTLKNFNREVSITSVNSNEILVTVHMYWTKGTTAKTFDIKEIIYNWQ